jgi:hypothetical protein
MVTLEVGAKLEPEQEGCSAGIPALVDLHLNHRPAGTAMVRLWTLCQHEGTSYPPLPPATTPGSWTWYGRT